MGIDYGNDEAVPFDVVHRACWREWGEALTTEAATAGFVLAGIGSNRPRGDAVAQWAKAFLALHTY